MRTGHGRKRILQSCVDKLYRCARISFSAARHSAAASSKRHLAQVAELVDAPGSGPGGGNTVEVRVLSWAPRFMKKASFLAGFFHFCRFDSSRLASGCARIEVALKSALKSIYLWPGKSTPCSAGLCFLSPQRGLLSHASGSENADLPRCEDFLKTSIDKLCRCARISFSAARHSAAASSKRHLAQVAELVDAPGSGPGGGNTVEVRVLSWAPRFMKKASFLAGFFHFCFAVPLPFHPF